MASLLSNPIPFWLKGAKEPPGFQEIPPTGPWRSQRCPGTPIRELKSKGTAWYGPRFGWYVFPKAESVGRARLNIRAVAESHALGLAVPEAGPPSAPG